MSSVSGVAGSGAAAPSAASADGQIEALRKQESVLTKKLKDVSASDADEKTKLAQMAQLTAQIQLIEAQIARIQAQQQRAAQASASAASAAPSRSPEWAGSQVDLDA